MSRLTSFRGFFRRNSINIALTVIVLALAAILFLNAVTLSQLQHQLDNQQRITKEIQASGDERSDQLHKLNSHIDCIVHLFAQPNHQSLTITDIQQCRLKQPASAPPATSPPSATSPATQRPAATSTPQPATSTKPAPTAHSAPDTPSDRPLGGLLDILTGGLL